MTAVYVYSDGHHLQEKGGCDDEQIFLLAEKGVLVGHCWLCAVRGADAGSDVVLPRWHRHRPCGAGLALFFVAFRSFFVQSRAGKVLSAIGSLFGVISGICFIGVACTPANLQPALHGQLVMWAFRAFPVAVILYAVAILLHQTYPKRFAAVFIAFAALLVLYVVLMMRGPGFATPQGLMIQATGQEAIVCASIVTTFIQSLGARKRLSQ